MGSIPSSQHGPAAPGHHFGRGGFSSLRGRDNRPARNSPRASTIARATLRISSLERFGFCRMPSLRAEPMAMMRSRVARHSSDSL
jgi:hypothetical protein